MLKEVTKEEWEQLRNSFIQHAKKLASPGWGIDHYYSGWQIPSWKNVRPGKSKWPRGHSKWTIRHFSPIGCIMFKRFKQTPVTCLLRSPDGRHYISEHLPGFCPIHHLIPAGAG